MFDWVIKGVSVLFKLPGYIYDNIYNRSFLKLVSYAFLVFLLLEAVVCRCFSKQVFLKISQTSQENFCAGVSFWPVYNFIKKRLQHRCFPVKFAKFLRTSIFTEHLRWLLLYFANLETKFREIIHSWPINEMTCLHERILSSYNLINEFFFVSA